MQSLKAIDNTSKSMIHL